MQHQVAVNVKLPSTMGSAHHLFIGDIMQTDRHCLHEHQWPPDHDPVALILLITKRPEYVVQKEADVPYGSRVMQKATNVAFLSVHHLEASTI